MPVARLGSQVSLREICGGESGSGTGFSRVLRFTLQISFHQCSILISIYIRPLPEGQTVEAWGPSKMECSFGDRGALDRKAFSLSF